jgi:hypothetical protein
MRAPMLILRPVAHLPPSLQPGVYTATSYFARSSGVAVSQNAALIPPGPPPRIAILIFVMGGTAETGSLVMSAARTVTPRARGIGAAAAYRADGQGFLFYTGKIMPHFRSIRYFLTRVGLP